MLNNTRLTDQLEALLQADHCTTTQILDAARFLLNTLQTAGADPESAEALRTLALQLLALFPLCDGKLEKDLDMLVDLLTARQLCAQESPALSAEYEVYVQYQQLLRRVDRQSETIRQYQQAVKEAEARAEAAEAAAKAQPTLPADTGICENQAKTIRELEQAVQILRKQNKEQREANASLRLENMRLKNVAKNTDPDGELMELKKRCAQQEQTIKRYQAEANKPQPPQMAPTASYMLDLKTGQVTGPGLSSDRFNSLIHEDRLKIRNLVVCGGDHFRMPDTYLFKNLSMICLSDSVKTVEEVVICLGSFDQLTLMFSGKDCRFDIQPARLKKARIYAKPGGTIERFANSNGLHFTALDTN